MADKELSIISKSIDQPFSFEDAFSPIYMPNTLISEVQDTISANDNKNLSSSCCNDNSCVSNFQNNSDESGKENSLKKGKRAYFSKVEDELLTSAVISYHQTSWNDIAQCIPGKTSKQCRDRWMNYLNPSLNFEPWSKQEDNLLTSLVNIHGTHWTKMKQYFPGRSNNSIKNRWYWLIKKDVGVMKINSTDDNVNNESNNLLPESKNDATNNLGSRLNSNNNTINDDKMEQNQNKNFYFLLNQSNSHKRRNPKNQKPNEANKTGITENKINIDRKSCNSNENSFLTYKESSKLSDVLNISFGGDDYIW